MNSSSPRQYCYCSQCGEEFGCMDLLVDHHSEKHQSFDRVVTPTLTVGDIQSFSGDC